jgi:hypothetical protein
VNVLPVPPPDTETSAYVRPIIRSNHQERGAVSTDPSLKLAADFLRSLVAEYPSPVVEQAIVVLTRVRGQLRELEIPTIAPGPDGLIGMTWEGRHKHVNVQIHPDHRIEYFGEDLQTGALWSDETPWGTTANQLLKHLRQVW